MNLCIKHLRFSCKLAEYLENKVNFKAYSIKMRVYFLRFMNSPNLVSPNFLVKNLPRKADLKVSHSIGLQELKNDLGEIETNIVVIMVLCPK